MTAAYFFIIKMSLTIEVNWRREFNQSNILIISLVVVVVAEDDLLHRIRLR